MRQSDKERMKRKARTIRALMSGLGLLVGTAAFAQDPGVPPAPPVGEEPGYYTPAETVEGDVPTNEVYAEPVAEEPACDFLMRCFDDECGNNWLADRGLRLYGFLDQGVAFNAQSPDNDINGPVTFNDQANDYMMNQLYLILEREIDVAADEWQLGGRVDVLYGTDYIFTQAAGLELEQDFTQKWNDDDGDLRANGLTGALYGIALPQFYAELGGNDLSVKVGHFYTIIGYEVVPATGNFFYSHAYTMQYGEPFTHTGVLTNYALTDNLTVSNGVVQGWDNFTNTNSGVSYLGGFAWSNDDATTSLAFSVITGEERIFSFPIIADVEVPTITNENRTMYSIVLTQALTDKLTYVLQHDLGWQDEAGGIGSADAEWYGLNQYLFYTFTDNIRAGLRGEWFRDEDGFRLGHGPANYYEVTAGLNLALTDCLLLRPEVRWDWTDGTDAYGGFAPDGSVFSDDHQFLFAADLIWTF